MTESLAAAPATQIYPNIAFDHVRWGDAYRLVRLGCVNRAYSEESGYIQFDTSGLGRKLRVIVKLAADDTYSVEVGRIKRRKGDLTYTVLAQEHGHYTDSMGPAVERLVLEHTNA
jgi:hypothetical protein